MPDGHRTAEGGGLKRILLAEDDPRDVEAVKEVGTFWAVVNEPPPGSLRR
jgi:hypothetical protein